MATIGDQWLPRLLKEDLRMHAYMQLYVQEYLVGSAGKQTYCSLVHLVSF